VELNAPDIYLIFYVSAFLLSLFSLNCWYLIQHSLNAEASYTRLRKQAVYIHTYICDSCVRARAYQRSEASRAVPRWTATRSITWITTDNNRNVNYTRFSRPQKNSSRRSFALHFSRGPSPPPPSLFSAEGRRSRICARAVIFMIILMAHKKFTWPLNHSLPSSAVYYVPTMPQDCSKLLIHIATIAEAGSPNCWIIMFALCFSLNKLA